MTLDEIETFCTSLPAREVRYPFESVPELRAWCIGRRMFAWSATNIAPLTVQVKAHPDLVPFLIQNYACISPGYHMNKKHWITVDASTCDDSMLRGLLEDARSLVAAKLPRVDRIRLLGN
jgi:predicted DNA-binding protein (MmcQ/YjbR family)